jgi:hypothetical protein
MTRRKHEGVWEEFEKAGERWKKRHKRVMCKEKKRAKAKRSSAEEATGISSRLCCRDHIQAKRLSKSSRKSVECHLKWGRRRKTRIASHP